MEAGISERLIHIHARFRFQENIDVPIRPSKHSVDLIKAFEERELNLSLNQLLEKPTVGCQLFESNTHLSLT